MDTLPAAGSKYNIRSAGCKNTETQHATMEENGALPSQNQPRCQIPILLRRISRQRWPAQRRWACQRHSYFCRTVRRKRGNFPRPRGQPSGNSTWGCSGCRTIPNDQEAPKEKTDTEEETEEKSEGEEEQESKKTEKLKSCLHLMYKISLDLIREFFLQK